MDKETELEVKRLDSRIDKVVEDQVETSDELDKLDKSVKRVWHIGIGIGVGLLIEKIGLAKLLTKLL